MTPLKYFTLCIIDLYNIWVSLSKMRKIIDLFHDAPVYKNFIQCLTHIHLLKFNPIQSLCCHVDK